MRHSDEHDERLAPGGAERFELLLDLEVDGALSAAEAAELAGLLEERPELEAERLAWRRFHEDLAAQRVAVRPGFATEVLAALPAAPWGAPRRRGWWVAAAAVALLALLTLGSLALVPESSAPSGLGVLAAIGGMLRASLLAGAGLLGASWRGLGLALESLLAGSPVALAIFGLGVLSLNLLFVRLLRRRGVAARAVGDRSEPGESP